MHLNFVEKQNENSLGKIISQFAIGNETHRTFEIMLAIAFIAILFHQLACTSADRMVSVLVNHPLRLHF